MPPPKPVWTPLRHAYLILWFALAVVAFFLDDRLMAWVVAATADLPPPIVAGVGWVPLGSVIVLLGWANLRFDSRSTLDVMEFYVLGAAGVLLVLFFVWDDRRLRRPRDRHVDTHLPGSAESYNDCAPQWGHDGSSYGGGGGDGGGGGGG